MLELTELSRIGFGGYRIDNETKSHGESLAYALKAGCNLVETASNYRAGESEKLIGKVCKANQNLDVFIITKTGYIHNSELKAVLEFHEAKCPLDKPTEVRSDFYYSLSPEYLERQIKKSCQNLQRQVIDGFLLHNPEYLYQGNKSKDEVYYTIKRAFTFLEEKVKTRQIRYYGVSSNTMCTLQHKFSIDFTKLLEIANEVSTNNHFKLVEFPFNLLEQEALEHYKFESSLVEIIKSKEMISLANRPFSANGLNGPVRLVTYDDVSNLNPDSDSIHYLNLKNDISKELIKKNYEGDVDDFQVIQYLNENWMGINSHEQKNQIINRFLIPLLNEIFGEKSPHTLESFLYVFEMYTKKNITIQANKLISSKSLYKYDKNKILTQGLCEHYLDSGIDCVLVGMRNKKYVDELSYLF